MMSVVREWQPRALEAIYQIDFLNAIQAIFPVTIVHKCVIHQIRNSLKYIASKDQKQFVIDLKAVYKSPTEDGALFELDRLYEKWSEKYSLVIKQWRDNWEYLATFFEYPEEIRKNIYTTNAVEALHQQLRKVTKAKTQFPNDEALTKMIYLAYQGISKKWTMALQNWAFIISQFSFTFQERLKESPILNLILFLLIYQFNGFNHRIS